MGAGVGGGLRESLHVNPVGSTPALLLPDLPDLPALWSAPCSLASRLPSRSWAASPRPSWAPAGGRWRCSGPSLRRSELSQLQGLNQLSHQQGLSRANSREYAAAGFRHAVQSWWPELSHQ